MKPCVLICYLIMVFPAGRNAQVRREVKNPSRHPCLPLTMRSAAEETLSTPVCTMQTYRPLCFSWMFLIITSPEELCWSKHNEHTFILKTQSTSEAVATNTVLKVTCVQRRDRGGGRLRTDGNSSALNHTGMRTQVSGARLLGAPPGQLWFQT